MNAASPVYCRCGERLHTTHCLAALFKCQPRSIRRMAALGRWPSTRIPVGKGAGEYRFTDQMIAQIITQGERWPNDPADKPKQPKPAQQAQPQQRLRRTPSPVPPATGGTVRPLAAKPRRRPA
jgi:hypothetical protein